ncbi:cytochrome c-type biogenesis protein [Altererythrobacter sp. CAU 1778]
MRRLIFCFLLLGLAPALHAQQGLPEAPLANVQLDDPAQESDARAVMETIRCLTCQGQSVADSDATMASDMRHHIRTRIAAGESPEAVRDWLIDRYGDYISYDPQLSGVTWPLFALPVLFLLAGATIVFRRMRRRA